MRAFDPRAVGSLECRAWETYYQRRWIPFLVASVRLVRAAFELTWPRTLYGAWLVLRANQVWAPYPDNDPGAARALMARFYRLLRAPIDTEHAARLEVEWWRVHREEQHAGGSGESDPLTDAIAALYAYVYGCEEREVRLAARLRTEAMGVSDAWVDAGARPEDPALATERALLVRSYAALLAAVHRP